MGEALPQHNAKQSKAEQWQDKTADMTRDDLLDLSFKELMEFAENASAPELTVIKGGKSSRESDVQSKAKLGLIDHSKPRPATEATNSTLADIRQSLGHDIQQEEYKRLDTVRSQAYDKILDQVREKQQQDENEKARLDQVRSEAYDKILDQAREEIKAKEEGKTVEKKNATKKMFGPLDVIPENKRDDPLKMKGEKILLKGIGGADKHVEVQGINIYGDIVVKDEQGKKHRITEDSWRAYTEDENDKFIYSKEEADSPDFQLIRDQEARI